MLKVAVLAVMIAAALALFQLAGDPFAPSLDIGGGHAAVASATGAGR